MNMNLAFDLTLLGIFDLKFKTSLHTSLIVSSNRIKTSVNANAIVINALMEEIKAKWSTPKCSSVANKVSRQDKAAVATPKTIVR